MAFNLSSIFELNTYSVIFVLIKTLMTEFALVDALKVLEQVVCRVTNKVHPGIMCLTMETYFMSLYEVARGCSNKVNWT